MHYLAAWEEAIDRPSELAKLKAAKRETPAVITTEFRTSEAPLLAAVALVDAVALRCPGTDEGRAIQLVEAIFERQMRFGLMGLSHDGQDLFSTRASAEWSAAMAAILYTCHANRIALGGLFNVVSSWWRQVIGVWTMHSVTSAKDGKLYVLLPTLDPELDTGAVGHDSALILRWINLGTKAKDEIGCLAARIFYRLPDVPLVPGVPWPYPVKLTYSNYVPDAGSRQPATFVSILGVEQDLPQGAVGTTAARPAGSTVTQFGWIAPAPTPWTPPEGGRSVELPFLRSIPEDD